MVGMMRTRHYYEAHVTVEPNDDWDHFANVSRQVGWRVSKFDEDEVDDMSDKWFMSIRHSDFDRIRAKVSAAVKFISEEWNMKVLRWKIEDTLLDSAGGDTLEMLRAETSN